METLIDSIRLGDYPKGYLDRLRPDPNDVCTIMPTGGTTGLPKGVPRTHNSYITLIRQLAADYTVDDIALVATPFGHNMALQSPINGSIYRQGTAVMIESFRPRFILEAIAKHRVTVVGLVPTQLEGVLSDPDFGKFDLSSLRAIRTAAAALPAGVGEKAIKAFGKGVRFAGSSFGMTEGPTILGSDEAPPELKLKTVGRRLPPGNHCKVVDDKGRDLPPNEEGELCFKGPSIFTGYYKASEANKEAFTQDGYFLSGDLAKIDENGFVMITGRSKDTIKRGGETITPGDIENMLSRHPAISGVAVVAMPDPVMGEKACAYVVLQQNRTITLDDMTNFLKSQGASVLLLPERLEIVAELPVSDIGKIDKKALRKDIQEKLIKEGVIKE